MVRLPALGLLVVFVASGQSPVPQLGIFMDFEAAPGNSALAVTEREVDALLKPAGIAVNWRLTRENRGDELFARLVVFKFKGTCHADRENTEPPLEKLFLGRTEGGRRAHCPFSEVSCDEVRKALTLLEPAASPEQQTALGMAMARVVAHELYHMLAHTTSHAAHGLAKASQPLEDLISNRTLVFEARDSEAIRKGFAATR
jgi:hypothetical protein